MARICLTWTAFLLCSSTVSAATLSAVPSGQVVSPLGGVPLDVYTLTIHATPGARVTAIDVKVAGGIYQVQAANFTGTVSPTASIDTWAGFPAEFAAADTHSLFPLQDLIVPPAPVGLLTEDLLPSAGNGMPVEGVVPSWTFRGIALPMPLQSESVSFAQVAVRRGRGFYAFGQVATSDNPTGADVAIAFPEPSSMAIAGMGLIGMVSVARRRSA